MIQPEKLFAGIWDQGKPAREGVAASVVWKIPHDLPYFNGHFPQSPIFPAIGIVDASTVLLQKALQRPDLALQAVPLAKFLSPITPDQVVRIEWTALSEHEWEVEWKEDSTNRLLATLRLYA